MESIYWRTERGIKEWNRMNRRNRKYEEEARMAEEEQKDRPIEKLWDTYEKAVIPANAGEIQRMESKRAFYAGVGSLFDLVTTKSAELTEDEAMAYMTSIADDAHAFAAQVIAGDA